MKGRGLYGIVVVFIMVLLAIFIYNRFLAKPGESVATLGKKTEAAAAVVFVAAAALISKLAFCAFVALTV